MNDESTGDPAPGSVPPPPPRYAPPSGAPSPASAPPPAAGGAASGWTGEAVPSGAPGGPEAFDGAAHPGAPAPRPPLNGLAVAALICGILGLAPAAIVLGHVGFAQARRSGQRGRGLAIAGFLLGYLALVLLLVGALAYSAFVGGLRTDGYLPA
ncbi:MULTISPECIES: DUF4190 domain-containing protein [unclassified Rathayibacter]|uniref:DUF4190 domain-containing protein n=1 Tax=unclassified Rathayibacter TaxID=2609250 RepID=UPI001FB32523|nr:MULTISPECIES: DUF4190 domain-containing protein [unclassified Rathayibacter]MCJ1675170.1 DUF4190 domain-containing protein [Rathayibacter sp. VKM Ac-2929]MCJ1681956.1 DUF4190 domain-containing protein [Rathayibacter sp. VKM Ac-2928]